MYSILWVFNAKTLIGEKAVIKMCLRFTNRQALKGFAWILKRPVKGADVLKVTFARAAEIQSVVVQDGLLFTCRRRRGGSAIRTRSLVRVASLSRSLKVATDDWTPSPGGVDGTVKLEGTRLSCQGRYSPRGPALLPLILFSEPEWALTPHSSPPSSLLLPYSPIITLVLDSLSAVPSYIHSPPSSILPPHLSFPFLPLSFLCHFCLFASLPPLHLRAFSPSPSSSSLQPPSLISRFPSQTCEPQCVWHG